MADLAKAVGILFKADGSAAVTGIRSVADALSSVGTAASGSTGGISAASSATGDLGTKQHQAKLQAEAMQLQIAALKLEYARLTGDTNAAAAAQTLLATKFDYVGSEQEQLVLKTGKLSAENDLARARLDALANSTGNVANKGLTLQSVWTALAGSLVAKAFIDANVEAERFTLGMTQVVGSTEGARKEFDYVREVANRLGIEVGSAADGFLTLSSATAGSRFEGEATKTIYEAVAGTMATLGRSSTDTNGVLVQLAQGISKGKFELEDLKSIAERMPGFFNDFAEALGKTTPELLDMISAGKIGGDEFLIFAEKLKAGLGTEPIQTYTAEMGRLKNSVDDAFVQIGDAGAFGVLTKAIQGATAAVVGIVAGIQLIGDIVGTFFAAIDSRDFSRFGEAIDEAMARAADKTRAAADAFTTLGGGGGAIAKATEAVNLFATDAQRYLKSVSDSATAFDEALKKAKTLDDLSAIGGQITTAFANGQLSAEEFEKRVISLAARQAELGDKIAKTSSSSDEQAKALARAEAAAQKAEEAAQKYALEMEKIASNERIKLIEAKVTLNVAQIEADTARIQAAFDSINSTITSTGDVIGDALGALKDVVPNTDNFRLIEQQLELENQLRREAVDLQKALTEAQIANLSAQTQNLLRGDALIKVDGAGLQPHLEAFMWEILRSIQVRVNSQGLGLLLGVGV